MTKMTVQEPTVVPGAQLNTIAETQARLRVGRTRVFSLIASGELEVVRFGERTTRVVADSVDAYIARQRTARASPD